MGNEQASGGLLSLPAELRNRIYEYALIETVSITVKKPNTQPALLKVCRQVRMESLPLFYAANTFLIDLPSVYALAKTPFISDLFGHLKYNVHHCKVVELGASLSCSHDGRYQLDVSRGVAAHRITASPLATSLLEPECFANSTTLREMHVRLSAHFQGPRMQEPAALQVQDIELMVQTVVDTW